VLVGATIVGSMQTVWHGIVNPPRPGEIREWRYDDRVVQLKQGEEMGRFLLGSTVVVVLPKEDLAFNSQWVPDREVRLGEEMANYSA
jgi:phosphatidylserine decarboxylase